MSEKIQDILNKKMDRKEFLRHVGYGTVVLFGVGSIIKGVANLSEQGKAPTVAAGKVNTRPTTGYGAGAYGG